MGGGAGLTGRLTRLTFRGSGDTTALGPPGSRRPRIVFIDPAETQVRVLITEQTARLDAALNVVAAAPADTNSTLRRRR